MAGKKKKKKKRIDLAEAIKTWRIFAPTSYLHEEDKDKVRVDGKSKGLVFLCQCCRNRPFCQGMTLLFSRKKKKDFGYLIII